MQASGHYKNMWHLLWKETIYLSQVKTKTKINKGQSHHCHPNVHISIFDSEFGPPLYMPETVEDALKCLSILLSSVSLSFVLAC